uniref:Uncharacterized protein n=1 Tax=Lactuca sativa TaxID=4236 RepID=A0A9R1UDL7_LACSA|nr:hypothetical protein LSAT_V11C900483230 [Lactuca sativa]
MTKFHPQYGSILGDKTNLRLVCLLVVVEDELMNKNKTNENVFGDIEDDKELDERIDKAGRSTNKFDDDVFAFDDNEPGQVLEEDVIITRTVNHFDDHVFYGNEVTLDRPRVRNPSKYRCPPYTELHTKPKKKRRLKKKVDAKSTTPIPPPTFVVVHDFSVLCLQPYVAGGEDALDWRAFMSSIATYPDFMVHWWNVDTVIMLIHSFPNHWLFGKLQLDSMEVHSYDSLCRSTYQKFDSDGTFSKFGARNGCIWTMIWRLLVCINTTYTTIFLCNKVHCYYCDPLDPFFTPSSAGPYMSDENFEELKKTKEQQKQDKESS